MSPYDLLHSTAVQKERAQEDFKVLYKGAPPHPHLHSHTKDSNNIGITLLFSNTVRGFIYVCILLDDTFVVMSTNYQVVQI